MEKTKRKTAIEAIGDVPWGSHFCLFYQTKEDLTDILVPYFKAGLENNEFCVWVTSEPLSAEDAKRALKRAVANFDDYVEKGQIEIRDYSQWYTKSGKFEADKVLQGWVEKENQAANRGFDGLRLAGNTCWLEKEDWRRFTAYEAQIDRVIGQYRMLVLCAYSLDRCGASEVIDVVSNHELALIRRHGEWETIQSAKRKRAVQALRESEAKFRKLAEASTGAILIHRGANFCYANPAAERIAGYTLQEFPAMNFYDIVHPDFRELVRQRGLARQRGEDLPPRYEFKIITKSGEERWVEITPTSIEFEGKPAVLAAVFDITERKRAEEALRESEEKYRLLFENANDAIYLHEVSREGPRKIFAANEAACRMLGYTREELLRMTVADIDVPEQMEKIPAILDRLFSEGYAVFETEHVRKDGSRVQVHVSIRTFDLHGTMVMLSIVRDITEGKRAEEALREKEEFSRTLFEYNPVVTVAVDREGTVTMFNRAKMKSGGRSPNIGDVMYKDYAGKHKRDMYGELMECIRSGRSKEFPELKYQQKFLSITIAPFPKGAIIVSQDITERKQAEEQIRILSRFPAEDPNPVLRIAPEGVILYANDASEPLLATWNTQIGQVMPDDWRMQIAEVSKSGQRTEIEVRCAQQVFSCILAPMVSAGYVNVYGRDITERKRAEEALRESQAKFQELFDQAPVGYHELATDGRIVRVNATELQMLGYTAPEMLNHPVWDFVVEKEISRQALQAKMAGTAPPGRTFERTYRRKDGTMLPVLIEDRLLRNPDGRIMGVRSIIQDITERKRAERELQEKSAALERFTYAISHDLRSPLVTVKTFLGYLEQDLLTSDTGRIEKDMFYVRTAADKMRQLLDELLELLRIGRIANPPVRVTFRELVEEALNVVAGLIAEREAKVQVNDAPITLYGDRPRLVEIWQNLVENAAKFMGDQASPRIEIGAERRGGDTVFFVRDNGIGIDPRQQAKVFDLFEKIGAKSEGAGLGLALVKRIVELYRGTIWLESKGLGQGVCFLFTLPGAVKNQEEGEKS